MIECIIVGIGGFIGAVCRYLIGLIPLKEGSIFPIKTFIINVLGCFIIGIIAAFATKNNSFNPRIVLFLKVGICGGFTTFSSFALETSDLWKGGNTGISLLYIILSITVGVINVFAGQKFYFTFAT
ncbi:MAG: fluoride efflux transporter CrcB [Ruminococcus sp.]|nr:fluoride efflux transporter CrcB [Ruminococcus sp.]